MIRAYLGLNTSKNLNRQPGVACLMAIAIFLLLPLSSVAASQVTLSFAANASDNIEGYRIYYKTGSSGAPYNGTGLDKGNSPVEVPLSDLADPDNARMVLKGLTPGRSYRFAAKVYDRHGNESEYSAEAVHVVPNAAPLIKTHQMTSTATANGSISPSGTTTVNHGESITYTITPAPHYQIADVVIDGNSRGIISSHTFSKIGAGHSIAVSFIPNSTAPQPSGDNNNNNDSSPVDGGPVIEFGAVSIDHNWSRILFKKQYAHPVVVAGPLSHNGSDPAVVRIRNIDATGFDVRVQEWSYLNDVHVLETISYMVIEAGQYQLSDGTRLEAGQFNTNAADRHQPVALGQDYSSNPVIMTSISTTNGIIAVAGRIRNVTKAGFEYRLQEQEASDQIHSTETVSYLAWEPSSGVVGDVEYIVGKTNDAVTHEYHNIMFPHDFDDTPAFLADMQTTHGDDAANIRYHNIDGFSVDVLIDEEQSITTEINHVAEDVGYILLAPGPVDSDGDGLSDDDEALYETDPLKCDSDADGISDADELEYWGGRWNEDTDSDGIINLLDTDSDNDGICDGDEVNSGMNPCVWNIDPQNPSLEVGKVQIDHNWTRVHYQKQYVHPVVVAGPLSHNGSDPAVVRIRNIDATGFDVRVQEWSYLNDVHVLETISYMVIEAGQYQLSDGTRLEAGQFNTNAADRHQPVTLGQDYSSNPVVMTSISTTNGIIAVAGRIRNVTSNAFEYRLQEQEASDQIHSTETVSYLAWEPSSGVVGDVEYIVGKTNDTVTHEYHNIMFPHAFDDTPVFLADMQTTHGDDAANIRYHNIDGFSVDVLIDEEQSITTEINHVAEDVGYIMFGE